MQLIIQGQDIAAMYDLSEELAKDLAEAGLDKDLSVGEPQEPFYDDAIAKRGDMQTLITIAVAAVSAGGALTALLGKDGFLSSLANVLAKHIEGKQVDVLIEKGQDDNKQTVHLKGSAKEIQAILEQINA